jgi:DNA-binding response OmpR family regulator
MEAKHVAIVSNASQFREELAQSLKHAGYEVACISNAESLRETVRVKTPDILVIEESFLEPLMAECSPSFSEVWKRRTVIVISDHGDSHSARKAYDAGAFDYLCMPFCPELLISRIEDGVSMSRFGLKHEKTVSEIMLPIEQYSCVQASNSVRQALELLNEASEHFISTGLIMESGHRALLVFEEDDLVGVLAVRNLIQALLPDSFKAANQTGSIRYSGMFWRGMFSLRLKSLETMCVREIMNPRPPVVEHDDNLLQAVYLLCEGNRRRVAVKRNGKIIGVVREQELFHEISRHIVKQRR